VILNERDTDEGLLVAVCDREVLGETFSEESVELTVNEEFYGGDPVDESAVVESLARADVANLVGARAVGVAIREGFVDEANVMDIDGTRHAQLLRM
jgi:hypothetical protein